MSALPISVKIREFRKSLSNLHMAKLAVVPMGLASPSPDTHTGKGVVQLRYTGRVRGQRDM